MKIFAHHFVQSIVLLILYTTQATAQIVINEQWTQQVVEKSMSVLPIKAGAMESDKVIVSGGADNRFKAYDKEYFNGQATANWLTLTITNQTKRLEEVYLGTTRFELITCWIRTDRITTGPFISGQNLPDNQKAIPIPGMSFFKIYCPPGKIVNLYLKVINRDAPSTPQIVLPFTICNKSTFKKRFERPTDYTLMFLGAGILMLIYNFLLLVVTKVRAYLYYATYIICITGYILGLVPQFAYPLFGHMNQDRFPILHLATLGVIFYILVGKEAMEIKRYYPQLDKILSYIIIAQLIAIGISPIPELEIVRALINYLGISIGYSILLITGVLMMLKKHQPGTLFLLASFIYLSGVFLYICQLLELVPSTLLGLDIITLFQIAVSTEFALASLSLGARLNEVRLRADQEKQAILAMQNEQLEKMVVERTEQIKGQKEEIEAQRDNLEQTLNELSTTQNQLIQKEKMASLGELTAGIAHEIQNPLNFVTNFSEVSAELAEELKDGAIQHLPAAELAYANEILTDLTQNLQKITHHSGRASAIVRGMLEHSRTSTGEKRPTDLNALCAEYFKIAFHGLRAKDRGFNAELITNFQADLAPLNVVPQELGRVLLNLYNNAFYAVAQQQKTAPSGYQPTVTVSTMQRNGHIQIRVSDNGTGIPAQVQAKIFQPFFTTKPTGEGTGLGLSLSYDIITKGHQGSLQVKSQVGEGTEFLIQLPAKTV